MDVWMILTTSHNKLVNFTYSHIIFVSHNVSVKLSRTGYKGSLGNANIFQNSPVNFISIFFFFISKSKVKLK